MENRILKGKPEGNGSVGTPRRKMILKRILERERGRMGWYGVDSCGS
jgi:hypothetical protein